MPTTPTSNTELTKIATKDTDPATLFEHFEKSVDIFANCKSGITEAQLTNGATDDYMDLVLSFSNELIAEYSCKTPTEKALARMAAVSYAKALDYSERLRDCMAVKWHSGQKNGYFSMIGKEVDRANRQFLSALMILKQTKAPSIKINVTAKNAFIADKQQLNVNQCTSHENIEPK